MKNYKLTTRNKFIQWGATLVWAQFFPSFQNFMINRENLIKIGRAGGNTSNRETPDQIGRVGMSENLMVKLVPLPKETFTSLVTVIKPRKCPAKEEKTGKNKF